ncbi:hypothetical protein AKO1_010902 [Acrasis kona]|uniref:Origin recognition complex subunit 1 n=1 Tax=Acrasis kona TaxID=1008807 RepID=A0AAW2YGX1_9EUKA
MQTNSPDVSTAEDDLISLSGEDDSDDAMDTDREDINTNVKKLRSQLALSSRPETLPCREDQITEIYTTISRAIKEQSSATMYIAGEPGTGKTASVTKAVNQVIKELGGKNINYLSTPANAFTIVYDVIQPQKKNKAKKKDHRRRLGEHFQKAGSKKYTLIVIDELDFMVTRGQQEIYDFFNWPQIPNSRVAVVGIANTVSLPENLMPKIANRFENTGRIVFNPYRKDEIVAILNDRVKSLENLSPAAIELCAHKVASSTGDIRRGLDICRRAVEIAGNTVVGPNHIMTAYDDLYLSSSYPLQKLSVYHKLFLLSCVREQQAKQDNDLLFEVVVARMQTEMRRVGEECLPYLVIKEVLSLCESLEAMQIVSVRRVENERFSIIRLNKDKDLICDIMKSDMEMNNFFE